MKSYIKRALAGMLALLMVIAMPGCGSGQKKESDTKEGSLANAKGRYIEEMLNTPEVKNINNLSKLSDGRLAFVDADTGSLFTSSDNGNSWESKEVNELSSVISKEENEVTSSAVSPEGGVFFSYIKWDNDTEANADPTDVDEKYFYVNPEGKSQQINTKLSGDHSWLQEAVYNNDGNLYLRTVNGTVLAADIENLTTKTLFTFDNSDYTYFYAVGKKVIGVDSSKSYIYDCESDKLTKDDETLNTFIKNTDMQKSRIVLASSTDNSSIYAVNASGLYRHVSEGSVMEQLIDGSLTSLSNPSKQAVSLITNEDNTFIIAYSDGEIDSYKYDAEASTVPEKQLNVYSLEENLTVRQAISQFRKNNPDVYVKYEIGITKKDSVTKNDAIKALNTKLLAGEGHDIIFMDDMPMESYIEKDMLLDMKDIISGIEKDGNYFKNILETYEKDGAVYTLPCRYKIPIMASKSDYINKITDLKSLADTTENMASASNAARTIMSTYTPQGLINNLSIASSASWIDENGDADKTKIEDFLTEAKRIYKVEHRNITDEEVNEYNSNVEGMDLDQITLYAARIAYSYLLNDASLINGYLTNMEDYQTITSVMDVNTDMEVKAMAGQDNNVFVPIGIASINVSTNEKELAENFIKQLLSPEVQNEELGDGFPVNKDSFVKWTDSKGKQAEACGGTIGMSTGDGREVSLDLIWPNESQIASLEEIINTLDTPCLMDSTVKEAVIEGGSKALTGEKSVEDCVNDIMQKISIYMEE